MDSLFLLEIGLMLILAKLLGQLCEHLRQPAVIGEIVAGMSLVFFIYMRNEYIIESLNDFFGTGFDTYSHQSEVFEIMGSIGIIFLLFLSGFEVDMNHLRNTSRSALLIAIGGVVAPFLMGYGISAAMGFTTIEALIMATILVATSVGVTARTLMDIGMLNTDVGTTILSAAIIDDILGILILSIVFGVAKGDVSAIGIALIALTVFGVLLIMVAFGHRIVPPLLEWCDRHVKMPKALTSIIVALTLLFAAFSEMAQIAAITGAFIAGLFMGETLQARRVLEDVRTIGYAFFIPLFFVYVGTLPTREAFTDLDLILVALVFIVVAVSSKLIGSFIGAHFAGFGKGDALKIGVGMVPRMEVALVVATAAISRDVVSSSSGNRLLTITLLMGIITTIVTPLVLRALYARDRKKAEGMTDF